MEKEKYINKKYDDLTIKEFISRPIGDTRYSSWGDIWVSCDCKCGRVAKLPFYGVVNGYISSCGCLRKKQAKKTLEQNRLTNPRPTEILITLDGVTKNISEWSKERNIPRSTIRYRLNNELPINKVLERKECNNE